MKHVAALYTCHNRKTKTLRSLESLYRVLAKISENPLSIDVYLTDDGSTDGTATAIRQAFPEVHLIQGDGSLFWAEGMRTAWKEARKHDYDGYLLLNDDVELYDAVLEQLLLTHAHSVDKYGQGGIYLGATEDRTQNKLTYSGSVLTNKFLYLRKRLAPNGDFQECDLGNANIMMVASDVVDTIGILAKGYSHGMADYDYTLTAKKAEIPVLIAPEYCGHCVDDHRDPYEGFAEKTLAERRKILHNPTGLAFNSYRKYVRKFFPLRYPFVVFFGWLKLYFPKLYLEYFQR